MNFGEAFTFVFKDNDWFKKVALAALCSLIPIVGQLFLTGWMLEITKRVSMGHPVPLPDLDLGDNIIRGLKAWVVSVVYCLPLIVISLVFGAITGVFAGNSDSNAVGIFFTLVSICFTLFAILYGLVMAFILPAAYGKMVENEQLGDAFKFGEVFKLIKAAPAAFLIAVLGVIIASIISPLGSVACGIGVLLTTVYSVAIVGHLYGQAIREAVGNLGIASVIPPSETTFIPPAS
jgi:hypothetical protein